MLCTTFQSRASSGCRKVLTIIPVGKTCWWEGVKSGRYPKPVKLSSRCTAWRAEDIQALIKGLSNESHDHHGHVASETNENDKRRMSRQTLRNRVASATHSCFGIAPAARPAGARFHYSFVGAQDWGTCYRLL